MKLQTSTLALHFTDVEFFISTFRIQNHIVVTICNENPFHGWIEELLSTDQIGLIFNYYFIEKSFIFVHISITSEELEKKRNYEKLADFIISYFHKYLI